MNNVLMISHGFEPAPAATKRKGQTGAIYTSKSGRDRASRGQKGRSGRLLWISKGLGQEVDGNLNGPVHLTAHGTLGPHLQGWHQGLSRC